MPPWLPTLFTSSPHGKTRFAASEANDRLATNHMASALNCSRM